MMLAVVVRRPKTPVIADAAPHTAMLRRSKTLLHRFYGIEKRRRHLAPSAS
jgi:hypothetical protein